MQWNGNGLKKEQRKIKATRNRNVVERNFRKGTKLNLALKYFQLFRSLSEIRIKKDIYRKFRITKILKIEQNVIAKNLGGPNDIYLLPGYGKR